METQLSLFGEPIGRLLHDVDGFDWNVPRLLEDYEDLKDEMREFSDYNPRWLKVHRAGPAGMHHALSWKNIVGGGRVAVGYYRQLRGEDIKEHTDTGCKTRINVLLTRRRMHLAHWRKCIIVLGGAHQRQPVQTLGRSCRSRQDHLQSDILRSRLLLSLIHISEPTRLR